MSAKTRIVVVLGMHRSGTSAITRGLQTLGVDLGESLLPPLPDNNEKGFFEDSAINSLNIELLHSLGSDWDALRGIPDEDFARDGLAPFKLRAIEILREKTRERIFGFKDPRVAPLLIFWNEIFQHLNLAPSYVIAVRHPLSVVQSLKRRDGFASEKSYYLWLKHVVPAVLKTARDPRVVVDFDLVMADPELQLKRLARALKLPFSASPAAVEEYAGEFLDAKLRHSRFAIEDLRIDRAAPPGVFKAYEILNQIARDETGIDEPEVAALFDRLHDDLEKIAPALSYITRADIQLTGTEHRASQLATAVSGHEKMVENLGETIKSLVIDRDAQRDGYEQLQADIKRLMNEREEQVALLNASLVNNDELITGLDQLRADLVRLSNERDELGSAIADRDGVIANLRRTVESLIADKDVQRHGHEQLQEDIKRLATEREQQVASLKHSLEEKEELVASSNQAIATLSADLESQRMEFERLRRTMDEELVSLRIDRDSLASDRTALLAQSQQAEDAYKQEVERLTAELSIIYQSKSWRITSPLRLTRYLMTRAVSAPGRSKMPPVDTPLQLAESSLPISADEENQELPNQKSEPQKKILLVSFYCPTRAHAGGLRVLDLYALIREQEPDVTIDLFTHHRPTIDWTMDDAYSIFHNIYLSPTEELSPEVLSSLQAGELQTYDLVDLQFHQAGHYVDAYRSIAQKIIFTPMESQARVLFLRFLALFKAGQQSRLAAFNTQRPFAKQEIGFCRKVDDVVCVSRSDAAFLRVVSRKHRVHGIDTGISKFEFSSALQAEFQISPAGERRCSIIYVAYFGSETNVLALRWYLENVHPRVLEQVPDYVLTVVGRGDLSSFERFRCNSVEFTGEVPAIAPHIAAARVGIAPALGGSGFRGKVNQYAIQGIPCVGSPIALKGLAYRDGANVFVANSPKRFADRCVQLLTDLSLNDQIAGAARKLCMERYSWMSKWPAICQIYGFKNGRTNKQPLVTALVPSYNHAPYIRERIESILAQTYPAIELIVIDDCSDDDSDSIILDLQSRHDFQYIRNKQNSGTPFAAWEKICDLASGEYIWVCESDDVAEPAFVETAIQNFREVPSAVLFYSSSLVINEKGEKIGHTDDYFHDTWKETRWDADFSANGIAELVNFQMRGQTVPNMSSAVFSTKAFKAAYRPFLKRLHLTGDWLFVGDVLRQGDVVFSHVALSRFRKHAVTSRERVKSARSQAEFILTKYQLFRCAKQPVAAFAPLMLSDVIRFLYEPASWWEVTRALLNISVFASLKCALLFLAASVKDPVCIGVYKERYRHAQEWRASRAGNE